MPQFSAVKTGVHTILDSFSCQHEKLAVFSVDMAKKKFYQCHILAVKLNIL